MSKVFPDWWYSDGERPEEDFNQSDILGKNFSHYSSDNFNINFKKKRPKSKSVSNNTVKELSTLLVEKNEMVERLENQLSNIKILYKTLQSEVDFLKSQYNDMYNENSVLKDIISKIDSKPQRSNESTNELFLSQNAPQEVVDAVWKALSKVYHPDCGGSEDKMKSINSARDEFYKVNNWK